MQIAQHQVSNNIPNPSIRELHVARALCFKLKTEITLIMIYIPYIVRLKQQFSISTPTVTVYWNLSLKQQPSHKERAIPEQKTLQQQ